MKRVKIPERLGGPYTGVVIGTYGADLPFAERAVFKQLDRHTASRVILVDGRQLNRHLEARASDMSRANRSYVAAPVRSPHVWHPKFICLVGPEAGRLLVGSGNLSMNGHAGAGECFTTYEWSPEDDKDSEAFSAIWDLIQTASRLGWIDAIAERRIADIFASAPWVSNENPSAGPVRHNAGQSHLKQFAQVIGGAGVSSLTVMAPFHDRKASAMDQLLRELSPRSLTVVLQTGQTNLNVEALSNVVERHGVELTVKTAEAPRRYPPTWIHAKLLLAKTSDRDILLQGSPNLSAVALCSSGQHANVEIANLLEGEKGAFDYLLKGLRLKVRSDGLDGFRGRSDPDPVEIDEQDELPLVDTVVWNPPHLEGRIHGADVNDIQVVFRVGRRSIQPSKVVLRVEEDAVHFVARVADVDAPSIDQARTVGIEVVGSPVVISAPYHIQTLLRLGAAGRRVELLTEVGNLDLDDAEITDLLAELDRVLIVDGRSLWRIAQTPAPELEPPDHELPHVSYGDLDWDRIEAHSTYKQYRDPSLLLGIAPTELGITLRALTDRFASDIAATLGTDSGERDADALGDDLANEQQSEDPDELDEGVGERAIRRQPPTTRRRRLWRNFIKRFLRGIADPVFVDSVGPSVVIPTYVVFEHLCRRLRIRDWIDLRFLTEAQIQLWSFMWGSGTSEGYLSQLSEENRVVALDVLKAHSQLPAFLASLSDAYWDSYDNLESQRHLRDTWQSFLVNPYWQSNDETLLHAAAASTGYSEGPDPAGLAEDLVELASFATYSELERRIADVIGVQFTALSWESDFVVRGDRTELIEYVRIQDESGKLSPRSAANALGIWMEAEPGLGHYRITSGDALAFCDSDEGRSLYFDKREREERELPSTDGSNFPWIGRLSELIAL